ncbi:MAG: HD domain-containing protein [Planctomycetes bacterium]|nr:HD domain-containing protein [Planctomycetota bacterium]
MVDTGSSENWEETLDRMVAKVAGPPEPPPSSSPDDGSVISPAPAPRTEDPNQPISVERLRLQIFHSVQGGMRLSQDIYDESGVLLLAAGSRVTRRFLQLLSARGIMRVQLRSPEPPPAPIHDRHTTPSATEDDLSTALSRELDERMAGELQRAVVFRPVRAWRRPRLPINELKGEAKRGVARHAATSNAVTELCRTLQGGQEVPVTELRQSVTQFVDMAALDFDLLPTIIAMRQSQDEYLYDHCVNVALLSMAMASQLGMERPAILEVGLGGLLQDIGMLRVPLPIRLAHRPLTSEEWHEIQRHPLHTLDMLANLRGVPQTVKFIAYQAHERIDGVGYPRRRTGAQLHRYAEIVSIADVYSAMTHERPYRKPHTPYEAAKTILTDGHAQRFDRLLTRAFLDTVSLFPIGSRVELSNGLTGRVLRARPGAHTRPLVEEITADGCPTGQVIDLSQEKTLRVVKAM